MWLDSFVYNDQSRKTLYSNAKISSKAINDTEWNFS